MKVRLVEEVGSQQIIRHKHRSVMKGDCACDCGHKPGELDLPPLDLPTIYALELSPACNNRCPGCGNVFVGGRTDETSLMEPSLSLSGWEAILDKISPYVHSLRLTGGEPTLHPEFYSIVRGVQRRGLSFTLFTNGRWQNPEHLTGFLSSIPQCIGLLVSLHGADAKTHEAFAGVRGAFEETVKNIRRATQAGITVHINTVLTRYNFDQIERVVDFSRKLGVEATVFNRYIGQKPSNLSPSPEDLAQAIDVIERQSQEGYDVKLGTCIPLCFVKSSATGCLAGTAFCTIDPWGNMRPCNHAPQIVGNLLGDSLEEIWRSEGMDAWRRLIPSECISCSAFSRCHGGCRAEALLNDLVSDPLMTAPLGASTPDCAVIENSAPMSLYEGAVPQLEYSLQQESFGPILIRGSHIISTSDCSMEILEAIQKPITLRKLQTTLGDEAVHIVGQLYERGVVSLSW